MALGQIHPLLAAAFKPGLVPAGVGVHLPGDIAELNIKCSLVAVDIHRELRFQQMLMLLPVRHGLEVDAAGVGVEVNLLGDGAAAALPGKLQSGAHGAVLSPAGGYQLVHGPGLFGVVHVDVPVIVVHRLVLVEPELVAGLA